MNLPLEIYLQMKKLANQILKKVCSLVKLELLVAELESQPCLQLFTNHSIHFIVINMAMAITGRSYVVNGNYSSFLDREY